MPDIFENSETIRALYEKCKISLELPRVKELLFGTKGLVFYDPKISDLGFSPKLH